MKNIQNHLKLRWDDGPEIEKGAKLLHRVLKKIQQNSKLKLQRDYVESVLYKTSHKDFWWGFNEEHNRKD